MGKADSLELSVTDRANRNRLNCWSSLGNSEMGRT